MVEEYRGPLRMKYEKTILVDFDLLHSRTVPCAEVPGSGGEYGLYPHKPLRNQGRFGPNQRPFLSGVEKRAEE